MAQQDPIDSITLALRTVLSGMGLKNIIQGFPDSKFFQVDGRLPSMFLFQVSDTGKHITSTETTHAVVDNGDGTMTVYKEKLRITFVLQLSLFTNDKATRSSLGNQIMNYLISNPRIALDNIGVETAMFKYRGQRNPEGETNFYQRDMNFEVTARVLSETTAYKSKTINMNDNT